MPRNVGELVPDSIPHPTRTEFSRSCENLMCFENVNVWYSYMLRFHVPVSSGL